MDQRIRLSRLFGNARGPERMTRYVEVGRMRLAGSVVVLRLEEPPLALVPRPISPSKLREREELLPSLGSLDGGGGRAQRGRRGPPTVTRSRTDLTQVRRAFLMGPTRQPRCSRITRRSGREDRRHAPSPHRALRRPRRGPLAHPAHCGPCGQPRLAGCPTSTASA
jgi:hypothetical protein